jgi:indole-3-glycerol phosphate synthase
MDMFLQVVSESGLFTPDDVAYVQNAGVAAVSILSH